MRRSYATDILISIDVDEDEDKDRSLLFLPVQTPAVGTASHRDFLASGPPLVNEEV